MKSAIASLVAVLLVQTAWAQSAADPKPRAGQIHTQPPLPRRPPPQPRPIPSPGTNISKGPAPFPGAVEPAKVLANVLASLKASGGGERAPQIAAFKRGEASLTVRRVLKVRSDILPPGYVVVELLNSNGDWIANYAMKDDGTPIALEDLVPTDSPSNLKSPASAGSQRSPLDSPAAAQAVARRVGAEPGQAEYVYFHNTVEPGFSVCRPLLAIPFPRGTVYVNSLGEAFVDDDSPLITDLGLSGSQKIQASPYVKALRALDGVVIPKP